MPCCRLWELILQKEEEQAEQQQRHSKACQALHAATQLPDFGASAAAELGSALQLAAELLKAITEAALALRLPSGCFVQLQQLLQQVIH